MKASSTLISILCFMAFVGGAKANMQVNGDFETGDDTGWWSWPGYIVTDPIEGDLCATAMAWGGLHGTIPAVEGDIFEISGDIMVSSDNPLEEFDCGIVINLDFCDTAAPEPGEFLLMENIGTVSYTDPTDTWHHFFKTNIIAPPGTVEVRPTLFACTNTAYGYWDNIVVTKIGSVNGFTPANNANNVNTATTLNWNVQGPAQFDVYLGTNLDLVTNATSDDPRGVYMGRQALSTYDPGGLSNGTVYFWRIDSVDPNETGNILQFSTEPASKTLTIAVEPAGVGIDTVIPAIGANSYYEGTPVTITANDFAQCPAVYQFDHWIGDVGNTASASTTVIMDVDKTVTAVFSDVRECGDQCHPIQQGDLNGDCYIDMVDFALYCGQWAACTHPDCD